MAVLGAAVSGMDAAGEGFDVRSLQEYELDRRAAK
jgi:carbamoyl-phosphate synthase large subunit